MHDANGNLLNDGQHVYKYDALNRQVAVYLIDGTTKLEESVYNAAGERVAMVAYQGGAATGFTKYLREGAAVVYEKSFTLSGGAHSNLSEKTYLYASGGMAVTKAKNLQSNIVTYSYYGIDHLGTARFSRTVYANGAVLPNGDASYAFEPFGVTIPGPNPAPDPSGNTHLYTGQERDALPDGTSIDYMHFRFYGASIGRFQKPDSNFDSPIANPQGWNLYSYVKGNPVNFNDPTGHMPETPERPEKPVRPYGMMGGLVMGVNDCVGDQVRQAIMAAETTVNNLIKNNGVAGSITASAEFVNKLKTDSNFRYGFTMWLATPSGSTQWNRQAEDRNSSYTYDLGVPVDDIGRTYPHAEGITTTPGNVQNEGPNVDFKNVNIRINYDWIYEKYGAWRDGPKKKWLLSLQFATTLGHESYHAEAVGSGKYTPIGAGRIKAFLDGGDVFLPQATPESYWKVQQYYRELADVAGPDPQPEYR